MIPETTFEGSAVNTAVDTCKRGFGMREGILSTAIYASCIADCDTGTKEKQSGEDLDHAWFNGMCEKRVVNGIGWQAKRIGERAFMYLFIVKGWGCGAKMEESRPSDAAED
jgi:hypothetical protein